MYALLEHDSGHCVSRVGRITSYNVCYTKLLRKKATPDHQEQSTVPFSAHDRIRGALLAGAVGDALGAPVEFMSLTEILRQFGPDGIGDYVPYAGRPGAITDDTQMTLFTAEGRNNFV